MRRRRSEEAQVKSQIPSYGQNIEPNAVYVCSVDTVPTYPVGYAFSVDVSDSSCYSRDNWCITPREVKPMTARERVFPVRNSNIMINTIPSMFSETPDYGYGSRQTDLFCDFTSNVWRGSPVSLKSTFLSYLTKSFCQGSSIDGSDMYPVGALDVNTTDLTMFSEEFEDIWFKYRYVAPPESSSGGSSSSSGEGSGSYGSSPGSPPEPPESSSEPSVPSFSSEPSVPSFSSEPSVPSFSSEPSVPSISWPSSSSSASRPCPETIDDYSGNFPQEAATISVVIRMEEQTLYNGSWATELERSGSFTCAFFSSNIDDPDFGVLDLTDNGDASLGCVTSPIGGAPVIETYPQEGYSVRGECSIIHSEPIISGGRYGKFLLQVGMGTQPPICGVHYYDPCYYFYEVYAYDDPDQPHYAYPKLPTGQRTIIEQDTEDHRIVYEVFLGIS